MLRSVTNVDFNPNDDMLTPGTRVRVRDEDQLNQFLKLVEQGGETNVQQKASWYAEPDLVESPEAVYFYVPGSAINHAKPENATVAYRQVQVSKSGQTAVEIYALRELAAGEELLCDYTYLPIYPEWFRKYCAKHGLNDVKSFSDEISAQS